LIAIIRIEQNSVVIGYLWSRALMNQSTAADRLEVYTQI